MRHFWITVVLVGALAGAGWMVSYRTSCDPAAHAAARSGDTMGWMRCEFALTDAQYAEIARLHAEHTEVCRGHCELVAAAQAQLAEAARAGTPAVQAAAQARVRSAEAVCRASVEAHVRRVAAVMAPREGERYLAMVLPRIAALDHAGPPDLRLDH